MRRERAPDARPRRGSVRWMRRWSRPSMEQRADATPMQLAAWHIGQQPLFELEGPRTRGEVAHRQYLISIIMPAGSLSSREGDALRICISNSISLYTGTNAALQCCLDIKKSGIYLGILRLTVEPYVSKCRHAQVALAHASRGERLIHGTAPRSPDFELLAQASGSVQKRPAWKPIRPSQSLTRFPAKNTHRTRPTNA